MTGGRSDEIWAIVPAKRFSKAKSRLSPILTLAERSRLARAMLHDVLNMLYKVDRLSGVLVVSADHAVADLVRPFGARIVYDVAETGVNDAVRKGLSVLSKNRKAAAMVIPADVPFAAAAEIETVIRAMSESSVVLSPALRDGGTNCLAMMDPFAIPVCFGRDSFAIHQAAARRAGIQPRVLEFEGLGHDIDRPGDLLGRAQWAGSRTWNLLRELNVASRTGSPALQALG